MKQPLMVSVLVSALSLGSGYALAADAASTQEKGQKQAQVYGSQLMTQQERTAYRAKMRGAKSVEAREDIRSEHHEAMKVRAEARGVTLPDAPPVRGGGR